MPLEVNVEDVRRRVFCAHPNWISRIGVSIICFIMSVAPTQAACAFGDLCRRSIVFTVALPTVGYSDRLAIYFSASGNVVLGREREATGSLCAIEGRTTNVACPKGGKCDDGGMMSTPTTSGSKVISCSVVRQGSTISVQEATNIYVQDENPSWTYYRASTELNTRIQVALGGGNACSGTYYNTFRQRIQSQARGQRPDDRVVENANVGNPRVINCSIVEGNAFVRAR